MENLINTPKPLDFHIYSCVRTDYTFAACQECHDICPESAFSIRSHKLLFDDRKCTACGACIGGCPSEALKLSHFDPNAYVLEFIRKQEQTLSCKEGAIPCLGVFDTQHFITLGLRSQKAINCDLSHCKTCELKTQEGIEERIRARIDEANRFLQEAQAPHNLTTNDEGQTPNARRGFFKKLASIAADQIKEPLPEVRATDATKTPLPIKNTLLKNTLKEWLETHELTPSTEAFHFMANKQVDAPACTNCGECVSFCPTTAWGMDQTKERLTFQMGKCIACGICNTICPEQCIENREGFDWVTYAFDRGEILVEHPMRVCSKCKCAFFARAEDETICSVCNKLETEFADMFKPAYLD